MPNHDRSAAAITALCKAFAVRQASDDMKGVALVLADLGGRPSLSWRCPTIGFFYHDLAESKAWTASALRRTPSATAAALAGNPSAAAYLASVGGGKFAPLAGSALLLDGAGESVCGIGVAGPDGSERDAAVVQDLAATCGLAAHSPKEHPTE